VALAFAGTTEEQIVPAGLDGRYRLGTDVRRHPVAARGAWVEGRTFLLDVDEVSEGHAWTLRITFARDGETASIAGQEAGHDTGFVVEGRASE
jgi:hypothetical protein